MLGEDVIQNSWYKQYMSVKKMKMALQKEQTRHKNCCMCLTVLRVQKLQRTIKKLLEIEGKETKIVYIFKGGKYQNYSNIEINKVEKRNVYI